MRISLHVQPGSRAPKVGGARAGSLLVRVREQALDGAANAAVTEAIARAFEVKPRAVRLVHGRSSRRKLVEIAVDDAVGHRRLAQLLTS